MIIKYKGIEPKVDKSAFIAPTADLIGQVEVGEKASIWFNVVIRADLNKTIIGKNTSIQDLTVIHIEEDLPTIVGENVTVGHSVTLHACEIGDNSMIGMGATVLSNAKIGKNCIIAAGSVVLENAVIPDNSLVAGIPAKIKRTVSDDEAKNLLEHALKYVEYGQSYK